MRNIGREICGFCNRFRFRRTVIVVLIFFFNGLTHDAVGQVQSAVGQALLGAFRGVIGP